MGGKRFGNCDPALVYVEVNVVVREKLVDVLADVVDLVCSWLIVLICHLEFPHHLLPGHHCHRQVVPLGQGPLKLLVLLDQRVRAFLPDAEDQAVVDAGVLARNYRLRVPDYAGFCQKGLPCYEYMSVFCIRTFCT